MKGYHDYTLTFDIRWTNIDEPGAWLFRVGDIGPNGNVEPPQAAAQDNGEPFANSL